MGLHVKICGITRPEDALLAESLGASALGYIFYPKSPRYIEPEKASSLTSVLGPFIGTVGVFVDEDLETVNEIIETAGLTAVQLHGSETPDYCARIKCATVIKAFRVGSNFDLSKLKQYAGYTLLLDAYSKDSHGGTGKTFDWRIAREAVKLGRVILAGGLNESNVREAVDAVKPWAIDISSGIEISPGIKDHDRMIALFEIINSMRTKN